MSNCIDCSEEELYLNNEPILDGEQSEQEIHLKDEPICDGVLSDQEIQLEIEVIDRTLLILDIFALSAKTKEGKLQVELAQAKYFLPRLSGISGTSGRFSSGGVGTRGPGETKLELDRRINKDKVTALKRELVELSKTRKQQREKRKKNDKSAIKNLTLRAECCILPARSRTIYQQRKKYHAFRICT